MPVEAPEGTEARTKIPDSVERSTSTVGFPRESMISRAITRAIDDIAREPDGRYIINALLDIKMYWWMACEKMTHHKVNRQPREHLCNEQLKKARKVVL